MQAGRLVSAGWPRRKQGSDPEPWTLERAGGISAGHYSETRWQVESPGRAHRPLTQVRTEFGAKSATRANPIPTMTETRYCKSPTRSNESGWSDLNTRPPAPKAVEPKPVDLGKHAKCLTGPIPFEPSRYRPNPSDRIPTRAMRAQPRQGRDASPNLAVGAATIRRDCRTRLVFDRWRRPER